MPEFVLSLWSRVGPRLCYTHFLLVNLQFKGRGAGAEFNIPEEKTKTNKNIQTKNPKAQTGQLLKPTKITKKEEPGDEGNGEAWLFL